MSTDNTELKTAIIAKLADFELSIDNMENMAEFIADYYISDIDTLENAKFSEGSLYNQTTLDIDGIEPYTIQILPYLNAENAWDECLESYLDEIILSQIPENLRFYFDNDLWLRDAKRNDSIFDGLSSYDGGGNESGDLISFHN